MRGLGANHDATERVGGVPDRARRLVVRVDRRLRQRAEIRDRLIERVATQLPDLELRSLVRARDIAGLRNLRNALGFDLRELRVVRLSGVLVDLRPQLRARYVGSLASRSRSE
jgi:hypothetical protein